MWLQAHHNPHHALPGHRRLDLVHLGSNPRGLPTGGPGGHQGRHPAACGITDGKGQDLRARRSQVLSPGEMPPQPASGIHQVGFTQGLTRHTPESARTMREELMKYLLRGNG